VEKFFTWLTFKAGCG